MLLVLAAMMAKMCMILGCTEEKVMVLSWPFYQASQRGATADFEHENALEHIVHM